MLPQNNLLITAYYPFYWNMLNFIFGKDIPQLVCKIYNPLPEKYTYNKTENNTVTSIS